MATPMQQQFAQFKQDHPDALFLFRLGDFFECFDDDAATASKVLGLTLTGRGTGDKRRQMAGFPHHALPAYLPKLVQAGHKVAIVDQVGEIRPGKLVERKIVEIISPGAVLDEAHAANNDGNYLAAVYPRAHKEGFQSVVAFYDFGAASLYVAEVDDKDAGLANLLTLLQNYRPLELLLPAQLPEETATLFPRRGNALLPSVRLTHHADPTDFAEKTAANYLLRHLGVNSLAPWQIADKPQILATLAALARHLEVALQKKLNLSNLKLQSNEAKVNLSWASYQSLGIFGDPEHSLFGMLRRTRTAAGSRLLQERLLNLSRDAGELQRRYRGIAELQADASLGEAVAAMLEQQPDYQRLWGKSQLARLKPQDLRAIGAGLEALSQWRAGRVSAAEATALARLLEFDLSDLSKLGAQLFRSLHTGNFDLSTPGFIDSESYPALQELENIRATSQQFLSDLSARESARTGISSLKVKFNKVFGYYLEISHANRDKVPAEYIRKQTLVNAERFITPELKEWEEKILHNESQRLTMELGIWQELLGQLQPHWSALNQLANLLAELDLTLVLAEVASQYNYTQPELVADSQVLELEGLRHPLLLAKYGERFVSNSARFAADERIRIITGPNMAGKSTYIRSIGLAQVLAQLGSFVPASKARMGLADGIYTRIGAADNLHLHESTFMAEMNEMSYILHNASADSLLILDEIGRGTATYDGLALAWSILEEIALHLKARTLFATHYHQLVDLEKSLPGVRNYHLEVEAGKELVYTYRVLPGSLRQSFGIEVAKLAGIRTAVLMRARTILGELERTVSKKDVKRGAQNPQQFQLLPTIASPAPSAVSSDHTAELEQWELLAQNIEKLDLDGLTPREAHSQLVKLQGQIKAIMEI